MGAVMVCCERSRLESGWSLWVAFERGATSERVLEQPDY